MSSEEPKGRDERAAAPAPGVEVGPEPHISTAPDLNRTLESALDEAAQRRVREVAEAARQSVSIVNAPEAPPEERAASARELSQRFREIDEAGKGGGALGRAVTRERTGRLLSLVVLVVVTAIAGLLLLRFMRGPSRAPSAPATSASAVR